MDLLILAEADRAAEIGADGGALRVGGLLCDVEVERLRTRFVERVLRHARDLEAAERGDGCRRGSVDAHFVSAFFDLAEELVGPGRAGGGPLLQAGDQDLALQLVAVIGVAGQRIDVEACLGETSRSGGDADAVAPALAHEGVHPLGAVGVTDTDAGEEARVEAIVHAGGRACRNS